jgi:hypothetical protein
VVVVVVVELVVVVVVEVVMQGFGMQPRNGMNRPCNTLHSHRPVIMHCSGSPTQQADSGVVVVACSHGAGPVQVPGPTLKPPARAHCFDVMT